MDIEKMLEVYDKHNAKKYKGIAKTNIAIYLNCSPYLVCELT